LKNVLGPIIDPTTTVPDDELTGVVFESEEEEGVLVHHCALMGRGQLPKVLVGDWRSGRARFELRVRGETLVKIRALAPDVEASHEVVCSVMGMGTEISPFQVEISDIRVRGLPQTPGPFDAAVFAGPGCCPVDYGTLDEGLELALRTWKSEEQNLVLTILYGVFPKADPSKCGFLEPKDPVIQLLDDLDAAMENTVHPDDRVTRCLIYGARDGIQGVESLPPRKAAESDEEHKEMLAAWEEGQQMGLRYRRG